MRIIRGDFVTAALRGPDGIYCHQVNCRQVAGAGVALQIRNRVPGWFLEFSTARPWLGKVNWHLLGDNRWLLDCYCQHDFGRSRRYTDYNAWDRVVSHLQTALRRPCATQWQVHFPYGVGCGLAGGEWEVMWDILQSAFGDRAVLWRL